MQVLLALADAGGAVLSREDLIDICWNGQIVGDDSINRAIAEVRRISRAVDGGFVIETIPRIGYRLTKVPAEMPPAPAPPSVWSGPRSFFGEGLTRRGMIGGGVVLAAGGAGLWMIRSPPADPSADLIEQGRVAMRAGTPETDRQAIALLQQAVARSPTHAEAWGLLALARARADEHSSGKTTFPAEEVANAAHRALQLDRKNADAKAALAIAIPYYGDWIAAERRFDDVLAEHRDHLFTRDSRSFLLGAVGRMREAALERLAFAGEAPFDVNLQFRQVYALWFLGRIAEADRDAARGLEMWPRHGGMWFARLWLLTGTGRFDRALAQIGDEAGRPRLSPAMVEALRAATIAAMSGKPSDVEAAVDRVISGVKESVAGVVNAMMLLNILQATDHAFALAEAYYLEQGPIIAAMKWRPGQPFVPDQRRRKTNMLFTPVAATMQRDPRFQPLMNRMGLTNYWDRRGIVPDFLA
jgi:tetratricopeptide (TPR) repeat protein